MPITVFVFAIDAWPSISARVKAWMILVDISVWVDHLRSTDAGLVRLLESAQVLAHPFVIGEIALGTLRHQETVIGALALWRA